MKKQILPLISSILIAGSVLSVSAADSMPTLGSTLTWTLSSHTQSTHAENLSLHQTSVAARTDFYLANSGALKAMHRELTDADKANIKKIHEERLAYVQSLSGMTIEQKAQYMSGVEDRIRAEIEARFINAPEAIQVQRMELYENNAARRAQIHANRIEVRATRGALRTTQVDTMIQKIKTELPNLSTDKKTKLAKKIDETITKIQANKKLPDITKTDIVSKLTALKIEILK